MMTIDEIKRTHKLHHIASRRGYIPRKGGDLIELYAGRFGTGYIIVSPRWDTTQYVTISYYIRDDKRAPLRAGKEG